MSDPRGPGRCIRCGAELPPAATDEVCGTCQNTLSDAPTIRSSTLDDPLGTPRAGEMTVATTRGTGSDEVTLLSGASSGRGRIAPGARPVVGEPYGPYHIVRLLGSGGMGEVYEAEHLEHGRRVALKVLNQRLASEEDRVRFLREGELAASVTSPHAVYVFGSEEIHGAPVIAMELLAGGTLRDRVQRSGPMGPREAVDAVLDVASGLGDARAKGILHRDIKPANCFITREGAVKIGDFGLSISTRGHDQHAGAFQGTPQFAAPEQLRGEPLDDRADLYAVGATLFYLLTGRPPFDDRDLATLIARVQAEAPRSLRAVRADVPEALAAVVARCLAKDRQHRPAGYDELMALLEPFSSHAPTPAPIGRRSAAGLVDRMLLTVLVAPLAFSIFYTESQRHVDLWVLVLQQAANLLYFACLEGLWGVSLGKAMFGLRLVAPDGRPPGIWKAGGRAALFCLPSAGASVARLVAAHGSATQFTVDHPGSTVAFWGVQSVLLAALFAPARARNGFAAWHDRLTDTHVVRLRQTAVGGQAATIAGLPTDRSAPRRIGPFEVVGTLGVTNGGVVLLGFDPRLRRRVWIIEQPAGAAPMAATVRDVARPARLRWLGGRRTDQDSWDAFEAVEGQPLSRLEGPRPWTAVSCWLRDLSAEVAAGLVDGSASALDLDRVWITQDGSARLLDFRAPGLPVASAGDGPPTPRSPQRWLAEVALRGLSGSTGSALPVGLPLAARQTLDRLAAEAFPRFEDVAAAFSLPLGSADRVTQTRRGVSVALGLGAPVFLSLLGLLAAVIMQRAPNGAEGLGLCLQRLAKLPSTDPETQPERQALETVIAGRFGAAITNPVTWSLNINNVRLGPYRRLATDILARHPSVGSTELHAAEQALEPFYETVAAADGGAIRRARIAFAVLPEYLGVMGVAIAAALGMLSGLVFRGGLGLRLLGIAVVSARGARASAWRGGLRAVAAWLPAAIFVYCVWAAGIGFSGTYRIAHPTLLIGAGAAIGVFLAGAIVAVLRPTRGLQDYIAGTWLVPA